MPKNKKIADALEARLEHILDLWVEKVKQDEELPSSLSNCRERLLNHFPGLLQNLVRLLRSDDTEVPSVESGLAAAKAAQPAIHAKQRFEAGYGVASVLRELGHLRTILMEELHPAGLGGDLESCLLIHSAIDSLGAASAQVLTEWQSQLLNALARQSDEGLIVVSNTGEFQLFSAAAEKTLGKALEGRSEKWAQTHGFRGADGALLPQEQMPLYRALRGERVTGTYRVMGAGNTLRWLEITAVPLESTRHEALGAVIIFRDVTEQKANTESLERMAAFREQFIGVMAHDLKNPLTAIRGYAGLALSREDASLTQFRNAAITAFTKIDLAAKRIQRMIDDVLDFTQSRLGGGIAVKLEPVNMASLCHTVIDELRVLFPDRALNVEVLGEPMGQWDPIRLMQVFSNLITNAIKYSPANSVVNIVVKDEGENVRFSVLNVGETIPKEELDRIFEPFKRLEKDALWRPREGLGLGLYIVRSIVEAHRGSVEVQSIDDVGTTFLVNLPKHPENRPDQTH